MLSKKDAKDGKKGVINTFVFFFQCAKNYFFQHYGNLYRRQEVRKDRGRSFFLFFGFIYPYPRVYLKS